jgi:hypothetical protein
MSAAKRINETRTALASLLTDTQRTIEAGDALMDLPDYREAGLRYNLAVGHLVAGVTEAIFALGVIESALSHDVIHNLREGMGNWRLQAHEREKLRDAGRLK